MWWCFCGGVFVVVSLLWCFCGVFFCGGVLGCGVFVVVWWCSGVFVVV